MYNMSTAYTPQSEIAVQIDNIKNAAVDFATTTACQGDFISSRKKLQHEARKLVELLDEPNDAVWPRIFQVSQRLLQD